MGRSRASAKAGGSRFERTTADYLRDRTGQVFIDKQSKYGARDRGDIANVLWHGHRLVIECKEIITPALPEWTREAQLEARNAGAIAGVVVSKRKGSAKPGEQWVHMTVDDLVQLLTAPLPGPLTAGSEVR